MAPVPDAAPSAGGSCWTIAAISRPLIFRVRYRLFAGMAREFIRQHPEWRGMRLFCAWVFATPDYRDGAWCAVQIESATWKVQFIIERTGNGIAKRIAFDREKQSWE
jgi:hypothetical protein